MSPPTCDRTGWHAATAPASRRVGGEAGIGGGGAAGARAGGTSSAVQHVPPIDHFCVCSSLAEETLIICLPLISKAQGILSLVFFPFSNEKNRVIISHLSAKEDDAVNQTDQLITKSRTRLRPFQDAF